MPRKDAKIAQKARDYYKEWQTHFKRNIDQYHDFFSFVMGTQWEDKEERLLKTYKKAPLVFNKLSTLINSLLGEQQQNTPQLEIIPDDNCDVQTAEIRKVLVKEISQNSDANTVYQMAAAQAFIGGFGAACVDTEYENPKTFNQKLVIKSIKDPTKAWWDIGAESPCKTDGMYAGYNVRMSRDKLRNLYGEKIEKSIKNVDTDNALYNFSDKESVTVQYWYERKYKTIKLYKLSNGQTLDADDIKELEKFNGEDGGSYFVYMGEPVRIEDERDAPRYTIKSYATAGDYVLEESEFPSEQLPIVFVDQSSYYDKKGVQICRPFCVDAKDAQRYLNYLATQSAYILKFSRYDQFLVSKANVKSNDTQAIWRDPGSVNGGLVYDVDVAGGTKPIQLQPPELPQSLLTQYQRAMDDIHTSTGMYGTRMGDQGSEISGRAIDARTKQGSYSTFTAFNAVNRAIAVVGQIINEAIPKVYDSERVLMLMMPDTGMTPVTVNRQMDEYGMQIENDLTKGTYQVRLVPGPSYEGQKVEARESLEMVMKANPQYFPMFADLYCEALPMNNNIELRNRMKTIVPPQVVQAGKTGKPVEQGPQKPSPEEQAMQMEAQFKQAELQLKTKEIELKEQEAQGKLQIEMMKLKEERLKITAQLEEQQLRYAAETQRTKADATMNHARNITQILTHLGDFKEPKTEKK